MIKLRQITRCPEPVIGKQENAFKPIIDYHMKMNPIMSRMFYTVTMRDGDTYTFILGIATAISINLLTGAIPEFRTPTEFRDFCINILVFATLFIFNASVFCFSRLFLSIKNNTDIFLSKHSRALGNEYQYNQEKYAQLFMGCYNHRIELVFAYISSWIFGFLSVICIVLDAVT